MGRGWTDVIHAHAECAECDFQSEPTSSERNAIGLAAQHHKRTGHTAWAYIEKTVNYDGAAGTPLEAHSAKLGGG